MIFLATLLFADDGPELEDRRSANAALQSPVSVSLFVHSNSSAVR